MDVFTASSVSLVFISLATGGKVKGLLRTAGIVFTTVSATNFSRSEDRSPLPASWIGSDGALPAFGQQKAVIDSYLRKAYAYLQA